MEQFVPLETALLDPDFELWRLLGGAMALLTYLAHRAAHQQFTYAEGRRGEAARRAKHAQTYYVTEQKLANRVSVCEKTIERYNQELQEVGLIVLVKPGGKGEAHSYRLPPVTPALLQEAVRCAKMRTTRHSGSTGRKDRKRQTDSPEVPDSQSGSTGLTVQLSRGDTYSRNGEVKSRECQPFGQSAKGAGPGGTPADSPAILYRKRLFRTLKTLSPAEAQQFTKVALNGATAQRCGWPQAILTGRLEQYLKARGKVGLKLGGLDLAPKSLF